MAVRRFVALVLTALLSASVSAGIYPSDHWSYSTKLTTEDYAEKISTEIQAGKTVFVRWIASEGCGCCVKQAPAWNAVTKTFAGNQDVVFMDVNLSEQQIRESPDGDSYSPGAGGWPTIRYFNKETGIAGGDYQKKTDKAMCDELGDESMMEAYIEEYGNTSLCSLDGKGCDEREVVFIEKSKGMTSEEQKAQLVRLQGMEEKPMKPELLAWVKKRKKILRQLVAAGGSDEL